MTQSWQVHEELMTSIARETRLKRANYFLAIFRLTEAIP